MVISSSSLNINNLPHDQRGADSSPSSPRSAFQIIYRCKKITEPVKDPIPPDFVSFFPGPRRGVVFSLCQLTLNKSCGQRGCHLFLVSSFPLCSSQFTNILDEPLFHYSKFFPFPSPAGGSPPTFRNSRMMPLQPSLQHPRMIQT